MAHVRLLIGPAGSGKTARCVAWLRDQAAANPLSAWWAVVPDRIQTRYLTRRLAETGGAVGVRVGTFDDLYGAILARGGYFLFTLPEIVLRRLLRLAVRDTLGAGQLQHFGPIAERPGFLEVAQEHIEELQRERLTADDLLAASGETERPAVELACVYRAYLRRLKQAGATDRAGRYEAAIELLQRDALAGAWLRGLVVDGFDSFEGHQIHCLAALARGQTELLITLPGETGPIPDGIRPARKAHLRFSRARERLIEATDASLEPVVGTHWTSPVLRQLEAELFAAGASPGQAGSLPPQASATGLSLLPAPNAPPQPEVEFLEVRAPADEAREAIRWLKACHLREGIPLPACAIIAPDPEHYRPLLRAAAREFGVPVCFTVGDPLREAPRIVALLELLNLPLEDYPRRALADSLRSPFFDFTSLGLRRQDADALEAVSRKAILAGGLDAWLEALEALAAEEAPDAVDFEEDGLTTQAPRGKRAADLAQGLRALAEGLSPTPRRLSQWVAWLEDWMAQLQYAPPEYPEDNANAEDGSDGDELAAREQAAHDQLREVLRSLVLTDRMLDETPVSYGDFLTELYDLVTTTTYHDPPHSRIPAIQVLRLLEARGPRFQAVVILGLAEGLLPQVEREDPFVPDRLRVSLGLEPRLGREQRGLFYLAVTRADKRLLLSRPYLDDAGEEWQASPYWNAALAASGTDGRSVRRLSLNTPRPLDEAAAVGELLFWAARQATQPPAEPALQERWRSVATGREVLVQRLGPPRGSRYDGWAPDLAPLLEGRFGPHHVWSASRLEAYGTCPLRFFVEVALELSPLEPPAVGLDSAQLGTIFHQVLERAYRAAADPQDPESVVEAIHEVAPAIFAEAPARLGFRPTAWWQAEQALLLEDLEASVQALADLDPGRQWLPIALEANFGISGPPLRLDLDSEEILLRGVIDRVDRNEAGELRVIDYKLGSGHMLVADLVAGRRLQLPLYALAAREALRLGEPVEGFYWQVRRACASSLRLAGFKYQAPDSQYSGPAGAAALAQRHVRRFVRAIRGGLFEPRPPAGGCPDYCAATAWCWRYTVQAGY